MAYTVSLVSVGSGSGVSHLTIPHPSTLKPKPIEKTAKPWGFGFRNLEF